MSNADINMLCARLDRLEQITLIGAKSVLNLEEAVLFTGLSKGHLYRLTSERGIPHFKMRRHLYFKKQELEDWMLRNKVLTKEEIDSKAATYVSTH